MKMKTTILKIKIVLFVLALTLSRCASLYASGVSSKGDIGAKSATAVTDPTADADVIAALKGVIKQLQGNGTGSAPVTLSTALSSAIDSVDTAKMSKGAVTIAHSAITATATSNEIDCRGFNGVSVEAAISGLGEGAKWKLEVLGCVVSGGTFGPTIIIDPSASLTLEVADLGSDYASEPHRFIFKGVDNYVKIRATLSVAAGTITVKCTPINL
jgi:hypothetical protein